MTKINRVRLRRAAVRALLVEHFIDVPEVERPRGPLRNGPSRSANDETQPDCALQRRACGVQRDRPSLIADDAVGRDAAPCLKRLDRSLGVRSEGTVNALRRHIPLAGRPVRQQRLQGS